MSKTILPIPQVVLQIVYFYLIGWPWNPNDNNSLAVVPCISFVVGLFVNICEIITIVSMMRYPDGWVCLPWPCGPRSDVRGGGEAEEPEGGVEGEGVALRG